MDEKNSIETTIDELISELESNPTPPSSEVLSLIQEVQDALVQVKAKKKVKNREELNKKIDKLFEMIQENKNMSITLKDLMGAIEKIKIPAPQVTVQSPEIKLPDVIVPEVKIPPFPKIPEIKTPVIPPVIIPEIKIPPIIVPKIDLKEMVAVLKEYLDKRLLEEFPRQASDPIAVQLVYDGKFYRALGGGGGGGSIGGGALSDPLIEYKIADIDDGHTDYNYYGFTKMDGNAYIMREDVVNKRYRYYKTSSGYPAAWTARASKTYDYFYIIFK